MRINRILCVSAALALAGTLSAQEVPQEGPVPTTTTIMVQTKGDSPLDPRALTLQVNGHQTPITSIHSLHSSPVELAILLDDGLRTSFGLQLKELQSFVAQLPPNVQVLVGYMENGTVRTSGHFSADHQEIASSIRIPLGQPGLSASPYFCLSDFVKRWPSQAPAARMVLMITNGVDPYNGRPSVMNQDSPYVQTAQDDAQRAGVGVYSIYYSDAGFRRGYGSFSGQSYLQQVADATGGELFNEGPITPVSIAPYLAQMQVAIDHSYEIGFLMNGPHDKHDSLVRIKVRSNQPNVKIRAPQDIPPRLREVASR